MYEVVSNASRIAFDDLFDLYDGKYVLLGYVEEDGDGNVISGIPVVVGDEDEDEAMLDLLFQYLEGKKHGEVFLNYFGDVECMGVYS